MSSEDASKDQTGWPADEADTFLALEILRKASMTCWAAEGEEAGYAIRLWSPGAEHVYGYTAEEALGQSYLDLFVKPAERQKAIFDHREIIETGSSYVWNWEADDDAKDGSSRTIITNCFRLWDPSRQVWLLAELGVDLKDKGDAERKLRALQESAIREAEAERSRSTIRAFETLNDAIGAVTQWGGGILEVASALPAASRLALEGVAATHVWLFDRDHDDPRPIAAGATRGVLPFDLALAAQRMRIEAAEGRAVADMVRYAWDPDSGAPSEIGVPGRRGLQRSFVVAPLMQTHELYGLYAIVFRHSRPLSVKERAIAVALTKHAGWATAVGIVGEELQHRREVEADRVRIETRETVVEAVLHTVGNEATSALWSVNRLHAMMEKPLAPGALKASLEKIREDVTALNSALEEFQREVGGTDASVAVDLRDVVTAVVNRHLADPQINFTIDVPDDLRVHVAELLLREALRVIVTNAVQVLTEEDGGGRVHISARQLRRSGHVITQIDIEDDGPGVAPHDAVRIWRRDFTRRAGGHGHGLPIARSLLDMFGGTVELMSAPSVSLAGAHFRVELTEPADVTG